MSDASSTCQPALSFSFGMAGRETELWCALMHLCFYEQHGTRTSFYGIVERAFAAIGVILSAQQRTQLGRNIFFKFLLFGVISKLSGANNEEWSSGANRLLFTPAGVVPMGNSDFTRKIFSYMANRQPASHFVAPLPRKLSKHDLCAPIFSDQETSIIKSCQDAGCELRAVDGGKLVDVFPSYKDGFAQLTNKVHKNSVISGLEIAEVSIYDFEKGGWKDAPHRVDTSALYKLRYEYGTPRWLLVSDAGTFEVIEGDWAIALARVELCLPLPIKYRASIGQVSIGQDHLASLPLLVRMALTSPIYQWPAIVGGNYQFRAVDRSLLSQLVRKLPALEIVDE